MIERSSGNTVVVIDGGGRGSALVDVYSKSPFVDRIIAVPGNDLMQSLTDKPVQIFPQLKTTDINQIVDLARVEGAALVDVAQDNAVEAGLVNKLSEAGIPTVGPTREAGQIEWDKAWSREFGNRHNLPQPNFGIFISTEEGEAFLDTQPFDEKWFVKAAYLDAGKGALAARNKDQAIKRIRELRSEHEDAANVFLIEKWLEGDDGRSGEEFSSYIFSDGEYYTYIGSAQDHKTAFNFDEGENTGGMGASTPPLVLTPELLHKVQTNILNKTIQVLHDEGRPYKGVLYLGGIALQQKGEVNPYVVEFNARWGDPEAQVILPGILGDFFEIGLAIAQGNIKDLDLQIDGKSRVVVTGASKGYSGDYSAVRGKEIYGLQEAMGVDGVKIYGAGVKEEDGRHYANGGRLFYVVGEGNTVIDARKKAYQAMSLVSIEGNNLHFRTDIGWRDIERLRRRVI